MTYEVAYLDRDGTINIDKHYLSDPDAFEFCEGALEALKLLSDQGLDLVVITNQSGIARGYFDQDVLMAIHDVMCEKLGAEGIKLAGIYTCPHGPDDQCECRKPLPGLIHQAEADLGVRPGIMIGNSTRDVEAGQAARLDTVGLFSEHTAEKLTVPPSDRADSLLDAAHWVLERMNAQV